MRYSYDETYTDPAVGTIDALIIRPQATATSTLSLRSLVLDDAAPGTLTPADILQGAGNAGLLITGIAGNFTLTGSVAFAWTSGSPPNGSNLAFQIKAFDTPNGPGGDPNQVPTPAALGLFGLALLGLAALRRRA